MSRTETAQMLSLHARVFVRLARKAGNTNVLTDLTIQECAEKMGVPGSAYSMRTVWIDIRKNLKRDGELHFLSAPKPVETVAVDVVTGSPEELVALLHDAAEVSPVVRVDAVEVTGARIENIKWLGMVPESLTSDRANTLAFGDYNLYVRWSYEGSVRVDRSDDDRMIVANGTTTGKIYAFKQVMISLATFYGVPVVVAADPGVRVGAQLGKMLGTYLPRDSKPTVAPGNPWGACGPCDGTDAPMAREAHPCGLMSQRAEVAPVTLALGTYVEITDDHDAVWTYSVTRFDEFWVGLRKVGTWRDGLNIRTDNFRAGLADGSVKVLPPGVPTPTVEDVAAMTGDPVGWLNGLMSDEFSSDGRSLAEVIADGDMMTSAPVCQRCQEVKPLIDLPTQGSFIGAMTCPRNPIFRVCQECAEVIWANRAEPEGAVWSNLWVLWLDGPARDGRMGSNDDARECDVRLFLTEGEMREARRELRPGYHVPMNGIILYDPSLNIPAQVGDRFMSTRYNMIYTVEVSEITRVALRPADGSALVWRQTGLFLEMKLSGELVAIHTPAVGDTVYRERDGHQGIVTQILTGGSVHGDLMAEFPDGGWYVRSAQEWATEGYEIIPAAEVAQGEALSRGAMDAIHAGQWRAMESEIWAGTDTMCQPIRTKVNKRKRNAARRAKHSVKRGA